MKKYIILIALILSMSLVYGTSRFSITMGETTYNNPEYKEIIMDYFQSKTDKNIENVSIEVIRASEVNRISEEVTGKVYDSDQIFSCAMVDLDHDNFTIDVDQSKIKVATSQMYSNALKSAGIEKGYVVVSSPFTSSGEAALIGIFKSYETIVGAQIPDEVKKAALKEMYLQTRLADETGESGDTIAQLINQVKNKTETENINDTQKIKDVVIEVSNNLNIDLTSTQITDISEVIANSQKAKELNTGFKEKLEKLTGGAEPENQLYSWLQSRYDYLISLLST